MTWKARFKSGLLRVVGIMMAQRKLVPNLATSLPTCGRQDNVPFAQGIHSQSPEDYESVISHSKEELRWLITQPGDREMILGYLGRPNAITRILTRERAEAKEITGKGKYMDSSIEPPGRGRALPAPGWQPTEPHFRLLTPRNVVTSVIIFYSNTRRLVHCLRLCPARGPQAHLLGHFSHKTKVTLPQTTAPLVPLGPGGTQTSVLGRKDTQRRLWKRAEAI